MRNKGRPLWLLIFGKWLYFELVGPVFLLAINFENMARTQSPVTLGLAASVAVSAAALLLLWCCGGFDGGGAAAVAFV